MVSGTRATGQILKTINSEGKIGMRSQSPRTMHVSSVNSQVKLLSCAPHVSPSAAISLVFRGAHPVSMWVGRPRFGTPVGWQWCPPCALPCGLGAPQSGGERSPEAPPTTFPYPNASRQWGCADRITAPAALPRSLHLALAWAPGWPCAQVPARLSFALILLLEPTHMLGSPTLSLPWKLLWPHPQGSDVGKGSWSVGPAHQSAHWQ